MRGHDKKTDGHHISRHLKTFQKCLSAKITGLSGVTVLDVYHEVENIVIK